MKGRAPHPGLALLAGLALAVGVSVPAGDLLAHGPGGRDAHAADDVCRCEAARLQDGWCGACETGHVARITVPSASLYEMIDPHGHDMDLSSSTCPTCPPAMASSGICKTHQIGYAGGRGYASRLGYYLALGSAVGAGGPECDACRGHWETPAWCDRCGRGRVGNRVYPDRALFEKTAKEHRRLLDALTLLDTCEYCAVALFADGRCPRCNIFYRDGHPAPARQQRETLQ